ncbi:calcium-binding protein [Solirubrobacter soli]|uniref:calcium-binding protein n=1 Tax=Solirubrobacter soli TaxID=363832 RepID=UPI00042263B8|nr:calcium-binding protein [Solirubrobacter soli]
MARVLVLAAILAMWLCAPARAGVVTLDGIDVISWLSFEDTEGVADDLRVVSPGEDTMIVLGPTVIAGKGCVPVPGGASCTHPLAGSGIGHGWERSRIGLGGGDDTLVVEASKPLDVDGGDGNDQISLGPGALASASGMAGDDTLVSAGAATLDGGPGNDQLSAGPGTSAAGGPGADRLTGSPGNELLVDAGDRGVRDVVVCNGGADITQVDDTDVLEGCTRSPLDDLSKVKYHWVVRFGPRLSFPTRLTVVWPDYFGDLYREFAYCVGAPCHGAKLDAGTIVSGGKRVRYKGRWWRGVSPGALVRVGVEFTFSNVRFTKGLEFRTRARALPVRRKRCTVAILKAPRTTGRVRVVPCT